MRQLFVVAALVGAAVLLLQLVLTLVGFGGDADADAPDWSHGAATGGDGVDPGDAGHHAHAGEGLNLYTIRGLAAAAAGFGLAGLAFLRLGLPAWVAALAALAPALVALVGVAYTMRSLLRLEHDGTLDLGKALLAEARVYIPIPGDGAKPGKVQLTLQGRTVEADAVSSPSTRRLATGTPVMVLEVRPDRVLVVAPLDEPEDELVDGAPPAA